MAKAEVEDLHPDDFRFLANGDDTVFAYLLSAGIGYAVSEKVTLDATYRYLKMGDANISGVDYEYSGHNLFIGIRVDL